MGSHPLNLALRFLLEIIALVSVGVWGWKYGVHYMKYVLVAGLPILFAVIWVVFNVPGDPSRSGEAPIRVAGWLRLVLELILFALATWSLYAASFRTFSIVFAFVVCLHYIISYDRIMWLFSN